MKPLPPRDQHLFAAVLGWLELGSPAEAENELAQISAEFQKEPIILDLWWQVYGDQKNWAEALRIAREMVQLDPTLVSGYIQEAYALRRAPGGGVEQARKILLAAVRLFPDEDLIPYNLACYAAQLGQLDEAWDWLQKSIAVAGNAKAIKQRALKDDDLTALWPRITKL